MSGAPDRGVSEPFNNAASGDESRPSDDLPDLIDDSSSAGDSDRPDGDTGVAEPFNDPESNDSMPGPADELGTSDDMPDLIDDSNSSEASDRPIGEELGEGKSSFLWNCPQRRALDIGLVTGLPMTTP